MLYAFYFSHCNFYERKKEESSIFYSAMCTLYIRAENGGTEAEMSTIMILNGKQVGLRNCNQGVSQLDQLT